MWWMVILGFVALLLLFGAIYDRRLRKRGHRFRDGAAMMSKHAKTVVTCGRGTGAPRGTAGRTCHGRPKGAVAARTADSRAGQRGLGYGEPAHQPRHDRAERIP